MNEAVYIRMRQRVLVTPNSTITIGDIAQIISATDNGCQIAKLPIHLISASDENIVVIDVMRVIQKIQSFHSSLDIQMVGPTQTIIEVMYKKKKYSFGLLVIVWLLLFIGSAMAIMNFHEDVSMQQVHQKLVYILTGENIKKPLLLQIPYSLGLGIGMILFFNHLFKKRLNEEPSPLEVEMFKYQQDLDQYVVIKENKETIKRLDNDS